MPKKFLRRLLPHPQRLREHRMLAWLGPTLHHPHLWHVSREGIARGVAIGGFFGFLIPIGQIPVAAICAIALRANIPMAAVSTLVTNPFTFAPIYYFAYRIGLLLIGVEPVADVTPESFAASATEDSSWLKAWWDRLLGFGKPLFVGLATLACTFAIVAYFSIGWLWRILTMRAWRGRTWRKRSRTKDAPR